MADRSILGSDLVAKEKKPGRRRHSRLRPTTTPISPGRNRAGEDTDPAKLDRIARVIGRQLARFCHKHIVNSCLRMVGPLIDSVASWMNRCGIPIDQLRLMQRGFRIV